MAIFVLTPIAALAQDVVFAPPAAEWQNAGEWLSPFFTASRDCRIEWVAYPHLTAADPQFAFVVLNEEGSIIDTREGTSGMGFIDQVIRVQIHVIQIVEIGAWEIRLFNLKSPPLSTETQLPQTTPETPTTTVEGERVTVTREVTIAVYTELPPERMLVPFSYLLLGVEIAIGIILVIVGVVGMDLILARKVKE